MTGDEPAILKSAIETIKKKNIENDYGMTDELKKAEIRLAELKAATLVKNNARLAELAKINEAKMKAPRTGTITASYIVGGKKRKRKSKKRKRKSKKSKKSKRR